MRLISLYVLACLLCSCSLQTPVSGCKVGRIVSIKKSGVFYETLECELIRGGLNDGSGVLGNCFHFTIENPDIIMLAFEAMETQREVTIHFHKETITSFTRSESMHPAFADDIFYR